MPSGARILLVLGGGIAAYKALDLIRALRRSGASVSPVMTRAAEAFVTPLSVAALAASPVHRDLFDLTTEAEMGHIELSRSADLVCVVPATANLMAKMAAGLADDLASTLLMATDKRVLIAPAMNVRMWEHPATRRNLARLREDGVIVCGPAEGAMACGEWGEGRLAEIPDILAAIEAALAEGAPAPAPPEGAPAPLPDVRPAAWPGGGRPAVMGDEAASPAPRAADPGAGPAAREADRPLAGRRIVVTSGPTHEPIDPVRYIANRSSGAQGTAIARALADLGAEVVFVTGPAEVPPPEGVALRAVETAREMLDAVLAALPADGFVAAAAVADWRVEPRASKLKKGAGGPPVLALQENPDLLATVSRHPRRPALVVGFAAETDDVVAHASAKRARKGCDWILANDVSPGTGIMGGQENAVTLITEGGAEAWPRMPKAEVAERLARRLAEALDERLGARLGAHRREAGEGDPVRPGRFSEGFRRSLLWHLDRHGTEARDLARQTGVAPDVIAGLRAPGEARASAEDARAIAAFFGQSLEGFIRRGGSGADGGGEPAGEGAGREAGPAAAEPPASDAAAREAQAGREAGPPAASPRPRGAARAADPLAQAGPPAPPIGEPAPAGHGASDAPRGAAAPEGARDG